MTERIERVDKDRSQLQQFKACGYRIETGKLKSICPACGVDKKFFEPFNDNISPKRRSILELHIHPIVVHFPIAISILLFLIILVNIFVGGKVSSALSGAVIVVSIALPFFVIGGLFSGIIDGILRFKKLKRPVLLMKLYLSAGLFIFSIAVLKITLLFGFDTLHINIILLVLSFVAAVFAAMLGRLGGYLVDAILPVK